jgi:hypothetical protein
LRLTPIFKAQRAVQYFSETRFQSRLRLFYHRFEPFKNFADENFRSIKYNAAHRNVAQRKNWGNSGVGKEYNLEDGWAARHTAPATARA